jgi:hypothetical protein
MGCPGLPTSIRALSGKTSVMWTAWPAKIRDKNPRIEEKTWDTLWLCQQFAIENSDF